MTEQDERMTREADVTMRLRGVEAVALVQMCAEALKQALVGDDAEVTLLLSDLHNKVVRACQPKRWDSGETGQA